MLHPSLSRLLASVRRVLAPAPPPKVGLFVDVANLVISAREFTNDPKAKVRFDRLLEFAQQQGQVTHAAAYLFRNVTQTGPNRLESRLRSDGYCTVTRLVGSGPTERGHSDCDALMAYDLMHTTIRSHLNCIVLATGDLDFLPVVERLISRGVEIVLVGPDGCCSRDLIASASRVHMLSELQLAEPGRADRPN